MINKDFFLALDLLEKEKGINKEYFIETLEAALTSAYKKNFGEATSAEVKLFPDKNTIKVYSFKTVVAEVEDEDKQISLEDAQKIKKKYKIGDEVSEEVAPRDFGRIAAQTARQVVMQKLREAEKSSMIASLEDKEGEIITGVVRRIDDRGVYLEIGHEGVEGMLSVRDQIPGERFAIGERVRVFASRVKDDYRGTMLTVTRSSNHFVQKLFEYEVPEIAAGEVVVKNIAREAGLRTKIAVYAVDKNLDPIGACVGNRGMRVNAIAEELGGEKIDIIPYSDIPAEYIAAALSPAKVVSVSIDEENRSSNVLVPQDKLSLAIGRQGHNVRLAARLTGWKIDVKGAEVGQETTEKTEKASVASQKPIKQVIVDDEIVNIDDVFNLD